MLDDDSTGPRLGQVPSPNSCVNINARSAEIQRDHVSANVAYNNWRNEVSKSRSIVSLKSSHYQFSKMSHNEACKLRVTISTKLSKNLLTENMTKKWVVAFREKFQDQINIRIRPYLHEQVRSGQVRYGGTVGAARRRVHLATVLLRLPSGYCVDFS